MRRLFYIAVLFLIAAAGYAAYALFLPYQGFPKEGVYVDVPRGSSGRSIARLLADKGIIRSRLTFELLCRWRTARLQAGEYFFDRPVSSLDVYSAIAEGHVYVKQVTVPEGLTMFAMADLMEREGFTTREAFLEAARDPALVRDLSPGATSLEGFLFPATYEFPRHVTAQEITRAMAGHFREVWQSLVTGAGGATGRPIAQVVTLASLVERETSVPAERSLVAGVFTNRLRRGVALQCDPTVIYALELVGRYNGSLDSGDLRFDSPYNTYRHAGLPPGPIANPGQASLRAALDPPETDYLYFVASGQGGHLFSRTLDEHNHNVAHYRHVTGRVAQAHDGKDKSDDPPPPPRAKSAKKKKPAPKRPR